MVFVADDLGAWLVGLLADAARKRTTAVVLGNDQQRALRQAATAAVQSTVEELHPEGGQQAEQLAMVVSEVFSEPLPDMPLSEQGTLLQALQAGVAGRLAVLDDASLTGTEKSSAEVLGVSTAVLAEKLTGHLVQEILVRGSRGGPLAPLADQFNAELSRLQAQQSEGTVDGLGSGQAVAAAPVAVSQLPPQIAGFTGRDHEIEAILSLLDPAAPSRSVVLSAVAGLAGVGKTALAVAAGHAARQRGWFGGGVLFINLRGFGEQPVEPGDALNALLRALGVRAEQIPPGVEDRAGLYRSVLAQFSDPVLVIADDAASDAQVQSLLPGPGPHKLLVTSRRILAGLGARLVDLAVLDEAAAVSLLDAALRSARSDDDRITGDPQAASRLASLCGGLPLALQVVAAQLKAQPELSVSELADRLAAESERLGQPAAQSVERALELSYEQLDSRSARMFRLLGLADQPISTEGAAILADLPVADAEGTLQGLAAASLIDRSHDEAGRWQMHPLVRLYAQRLSDAQAEADGREDARDRLLRYLDAGVDQAVKSESARYGPEPVGRDFYTTTDSVGYSAYAEAIARAIQHRETRPPLTIGIKGPWGAGKTSLMRMVQDRLEWPQGNRPDGQKVKRRQIHLTPKARELTYQGEQGGQLSPNGVRNGTVLHALVAGQDSQDDEPQTIKAEPTPLPAENPEVPGWRPTVWFNPWMYQTGEQVWAGLAHEIITQITDRMSVKEREFFWLKLNLKRIDEQAVRRKIYGIVIDRLVPYAIAVLIFVAVGVALLATDISRWWTVGLAGGAPVAFGLVGIAQIRSVLSARVSGSMSQLIQPATAGKNVTSEIIGGMYKEVIESPDYTARSGFFYLVRSDVQRVLDLVATDEQPVVIFVDDLDRCSPGTVVQVIEAINLFLAGEYPNAIFVAAMEPEMVAAHIEAAYEGLAEALETAGLDEAQAVNLGWKFLDKIVQLPLTLPALEPDRTITYFASLFPGAIVAPSIVDTAESQLDVEKQLRELSGTSLIDAVRMSQVAPSTGAEAEALRQVIDKQLTIGNDEVRKIISQVSPWLAANPRAMKRFVNVFRFLVMIDSERGFRGLPGTGDLGAIAKLAMVHIRWPDLVAVLGKERPALDKRTVYELLEDQSPTWADDGQPATKDLVLDLQRCGLTGKMADRIAAIDLRMFISSDPKIGLVARSYLLSYGASGRSTGVCGVWIKSASQPAASGHDSSFRPARSVRI